MNFISGLSLKSKLSILATILLAVGLFVGLRYSQQNQENRSKASGESWNAATPYPAGAIVSYGGYQWKSSKVVPAGVAPLGSGDGSAADKQTLLAQRVGFGRNATGGTTVFHVKNANDSGPDSLRDALSNGGRWIVFDSDYTINVTSVLAVPSNTTIDGRGRNIVLNGPGSAQRSMDIVDVIGVSNVIIANITVQNASGTLGQNTNPTGDDIHVGASHDVWFDHLTLSKSGDKQLATENGAYNFTISWSHFVGGIGDDPAGEQMWSSGNQTNQVAEAVETITSHHNFFDGLVNSVTNPATGKQMHAGYRMPEFSYGVLMHKFNDISLGWVGYGVHCQRVGHCFVDDSVFDSSGDKDGILYTVAGSGCNDTGTHCDNRPGLVKTQNNILIHGALAPQNQPDQVPNPSSYYPYTPDPVIADNGVSLMTKVTVFSGSGTSPWVLNGTTPTSGPTSAPRITTTPTPISNAGIAKAVHWAANTETGSLEKDTRDMQAAGITWARVNFNSSTPATFLDSVVSTAKSHNVKILPVVGSIPENDLGTTTDRQNFKSWLAGLVTRYKNNIKVWEIHNEENLSFFNTPAPSDPGYNAAVHRYVLHLQDAHDIIKGIDPSLQVMIGGLSSWTIEPYMDRLIAENAAQWFDIMAYHPYASDPNAAIAQMNILRNKMQGTGFASKPLWITEIGFGNADINGPYPGIVPDEQTKAAYLTDIYTKLKTWGISSPIFWYIFTEGTYNGYHTNVNGYSLVRRFPDGSSSYLPSYNAIQSLWNSSPPPSANPTIIPTSSPIPPTSTPVPGVTRLSLNLKFHGIGTGGDSANPNGGGNANPVHRSKTVTIEVLNANNQPVVTKNMNVNFNASLGNFTGTVDLGTSFSSGIYLVRIKADQFLKAQVSGIQTITSGINNQISQTVLISGDINGNNIVNILDYNILMGCYSDALPAASCTTTNKILADLNDDGAVNQYDYNLLLREMTNIRGD